MLRSISAAISAALVVAVGAGSALAGNYHPPKHDGGSSTTTITTQVQVANQGSSVDQSSSATALAGTVQIGSTKGGSPWSKPSGGSNSASSTTTNTATSMNVASAPNALWQFEGINP